MGVILLLSGSAREMIWIQHYKKNFVSKKGEILVRDEFVEWRNNYVSELAVLYFAIYKEYTAILDKVSI